MGYRRIAIISLVSYSLVAPTLKVAMEGMSSDMAVFVSNLVVLVLALVIAVVKNQRITAYLQHPKMPHMVLVGLLIGISLLSFYRAIALGPISVVVPIYGLFIVASAVIGIVFFDEQLNGQKVLGIALAVVSIYLIAQS